MHFKTISKPADLPLAELRRLFEVLELNPGLLNSLGRARRPWPTCSPRRRS